MAGVQIEQVDERDSSWEGEPRFRVYLHGSSATETAGWTDTYDITGADVAQVIDWAQRQAGHMLTYAVALVVDDEAKECRSPGTGRGLVWLLGMDGNDNTSAVPSERRVQERMVLRRRTPIWLGEADRMPPGVPGPYEDGARRG